ncbi:MAG: bifunctional methionine sulfoxide reductase B/A protein [Planctomycetota bacterium]
MSPSDQSPYGPLTSKEKHVIEDKGTEAPFVGEYTDNKDKGIYACRKCGRALYTSESKFHSGCGWPSFDDEIPGAVSRHTDADGRRTEIVCQHCGGHLGHVFLGEGFTNKDTRHCVNSLSLKFIPAAKVGRAYFGGGCFWGVEHLMQMEKGVLSVDSGYMGGTTKNPTYEDVCRHTTGHAEVVEVVFDMNLTDYETLAKIFFEIHDPTQVNRQGPDIGDQYRSVVFCTDASQKTVIEKLIGLLTAKGLKIATKIETGGKFYRAEDYHQDYYEHKGTEPYCHRRVSRF